MVRTSTPRAIRFGRAGFSNVVLPELSLRPLCLEVRFKAGRWVQPGGPALEYKTWAKGCKPERVCGEKGGKKSRVWGGERSVQARGGWGRASLFRPWGAPD